jgi:hypothetical protein
MLQALIERQAHYNDLISQARARDGAGPIDASVAAKWNALVDQLRAAGEEIGVLADDAKAQGPETLQRLRDPAVKADLTLKAPASDNPEQYALALAVMMNGTAHAMRDASEQLQRLSQMMSSVADPGVLVFAAELDQLALKLRPPGMPPGPYAPFNRPATPNN